RPLAAPDSSPTRRSSDLVVVQADRPAHTAVDLRRVAPQEVGGPVILGRVQPERHATPRADGPDHWDPLTERRRAGQHKGVRLPVAKGCAMQGNLAGSHTVRLPDPPGSVVLL